MPVFLSSFRVAGFLLYTGNNDSSRYNWPGWLVSYVLPNSKKRRSLFLRSGSRKCFPNLFQARGPHNIQLSTQIVDHFYCGLQFRFPEIGTIGDGIGEDFIKPLPTRNPAIFSCMAAWSLPVSTEGEILIFRRDFYMIEPVNSHNFFHQVCGQLHIRLMIMEQRSKGHPVLHGECQNPVPAEYFLLQRNDNFFH